MIWVLFGQTNPQSSPFGRDDRSRKQSGTVISQDAQANGCLVTGRKINEAHNTAMWQPALNSQRAKILIEGYENASIFMSASEDSFITGIKRPVAGPNHIVAGSGQAGSYERTRHTSIEQHFHVEASSRGSILSWATILQA